jgi:phosphoserine phosphatase
MRVEELIEIAKTVPFHPGADELINYLKDKGLKLSLVSSGLSVLTNWVHQRYGFDYSISNDLLHGDGILTGKVNIRVYYDQKAEWVKRILKEFGVKPEESMAIGDSLGDLEMFRVVGFSVAFNSSCKDLDQIAKVCVQSQNLIDIIPKLPL